MARLVAWGIILLALLNVAFLVLLPALAGSAARSLDLPRPETLPAPENLLQAREEPVAPVEDLDEALRLPRIDASPTDEHSQTALNAYHAGDYERAFKESVLALDPTPIEENQLYNVLTTKDLWGNDARVQKPNGRQALKILDDTLRPILEEGDDQTSARLNNAAAMLILRAYHEDSLPPPSYQEIPATPWMAQELAYQAADLRPSSCPTLLNLTLFDAMGRSFGTDSLMAVAFGTDFDLDHSSRAAWTDLYPAEGCEDPALLYYLIQGSIGEFVSTGGNFEDLAPTMRMADRLQQDPRWAGIARSAKGDAYYWGGIYALERTHEPRPFTARRYFESALREYDAALALQPDDPAIRNGRALAYLELGKGETRDRVHQATLDKAVAEAEAALRSAPGSFRFQQTLMEIHEAKGDFDAAAKLGRDSLSTRRLGPTPATLVPYSAISHGAGDYLELNALYPGGGAGGAFNDEDVIEPFEPRPYVSDVGYGWSTLGGLDQYREELRHYGLLRDDLLGGNYSLLEEDLERAPGEAQRNVSTMLVGSVALLLRQPDDPSTPAPKTQASIDETLTVLRDDYFYSRGSSSSRANPTEPQGEDLFYQEAGNLFRQHAQYDKAIRVYDIWRTELEREKAGDERRAEVEKLLGEAHFLAGGHEEALQAFDRAARLRPGWPPYTVRLAFMHEQLAEYDRAKELYLKAFEGMLAKADWMDPSTLEELSPMDLYYPDNYQTLKHLGDILLRQAEASERIEEEGSEAVQNRYAQAAEVYRAALVAELAQQSYGSLGGVTSAPAVANNMGIALLKAGEYRQSIDVLGTLMLPNPSFDERDERRQEVLKILLGPSGAPATWENPYTPSLNPADPPTPDENNPVFRLNLGWAYELSGEEGKAEEQYLAAARSDPSFHPALNDLGVMAAKRGDLDGARSYFGAALEARPDYDYASHNLGVALLRSGPRGFVAAQDHLSRAARQNRSLVQTGYDYVFDNELYFLNLSLGTSVPPDWQFATHARRSTFAVSLFAAALLILRIARGALVAKGRETVIGAFTSTLRRFGLGPLLDLLVRLRDRWLGFLTAWQPSSGGPWLTPLALLVSAPAIVVVQGWSLLWEDAAGKLPMLAILLYLTLVSLLVHHAGHALVALWFSMRVREAPWPAGIAQAVALVAIGGPAVTPVPAAGVVGEEKGRDGARSLVYLAGPLVSVAFAALLYVLFLFEPVPLLSLGAALNLSLAAASLISLPPLDAGMMARGKYARWIVAAETLLTILTALIAAGVYLSSI